MESLYLLIPLSVIVVFIALWIFFVRWTMDSLMISMALACGFCRMMIDPPRRPTSATEPSVMCTFISMACNVLLAWTR